MRGLLASLLCVVAACREGRVYYDVSYDPRFGHATTMDIHLPEGSGEGRPAILLIHGGGWKLGDKAGYKNAAERFADAGFVAATINYRLVPSGAFPANVQDCICALSHVRAHAADYGIAPDRIAVSGYSAGGHLSALVGVAADAPELAPDCESGPTGLPNAVIPGASRYDMRDQDNDLVREYLGGGPDDVPDRYALASPLLHVKAGAPPFLFLHGQADLVPIGDAFVMRDALRAAGGDADLLELRGAGHVTSLSGDSSFEYLQAASDMPEAWLATIDFLDRTLGRP